MSKKRSARVPPYQRHKSGQGKVRIAGKDFYLGRHGTPSGCLPSSSSTVRGLRSPWHYQVSDRPYGRRLKLQISHVWKNMSK
jgi:hypothetical protein